nr:hypothetical protein [Nocardia altamirensis]
MRAGQRVVVSCSGRLARGGGVAAQERAEEGAEDHGGDGAGVDIGADRAALDELVQDVFDLGDAGFDGAGHDVGEEFGHAFGFADEPALHEIGRAATKTAGNLTWLKIADLG